MDYFLSDILLTIMPTTLSVYGMLLGYAIDAPAILIPVLVGAAPRREIGRALASFPAFFLLRTVSAVFFLSAICSEWVMGRRFLIYEKGH